MARRPDGSVIAPPVRSREEEEEAERKRQKEAGWDLWDKFKSIFSFDFGGMFGTIFSGLLWIGVLSGIYFIAREYKDQIGELFGNKEGVDKFFTWGDEMIAGLADKLGFGFDVTKPLAAMDDDAFKKKVAGEKNEEMSPELAAVLTKHRKDFLSIAAEANGGTASESQLTNDKTLFALLKNKPEMLGEIAAVALKPGTSKDGKFAKKITASLKTIITDTAPVEGDKDRLTILLSGEQRAKTVALLKQLLPDNMKALPDKIIVDGKDGMDAGKATPQLRTALTNALDIAFNTPAPAAAAGNTPTAGAGAPAPVASSPITQMINSVMPADKKGVPQFSTTAAMTAFMNPTNRALIRENGVSNVAAAVETVAPQSASLVTKRNLSALLDFADRIDTAAKDDAAKAHAAKMMQSLAGMIGGGKNEALFEGLSPTEISAFFKEKTNREAVATLLNAIEISKLPPKQKQLVATLRYRFGDDKQGLAQILVNEEAVGQLLDKLNSDQTTQSCSAVEKADPVIGWGTLLNPLVSSTIRENSHDINAIAKSLALANCTQDTGTASGAIRRPVELAAAPTR